MSLRMQKNEEGSGFSRQMATANTLLSRFERQRECDALSVTDSPGARVSATESMDKMEELEEERWNVGTSYGGKA